MKNLETGTDKIKKICDILKAETLDPAKQEAQLIIEQARGEALEIVRMAEKKRDEIIQGGKAAIEKERSVFQAALILACKQAKEALKQDIEENLFNKELQVWLNETAADPALMGKLISALIIAIEKDGLDADLSLALGAKAKKDEIIRSVIERVQTKLKGSSITAGNFIGGVQVKMGDKNIMIDMSTNAINELLEKYIGKNFHQYLFESA